MNEGIDIKDVLARLLHVENELKLKDQQIANIRDEFTKKLENVESSFETKIRNRDAIIDQLSDQLRDSTTTSYSDAVRNADGSTETPKTEKDLLVITDSILKHADAEVLNPGGDTSIECIPGARPDAIAKRFAKLSKTNTYKRVIVHTGTNLIPRYSRSFVADKVVKCMEQVRNILPKSSKLAFSSILPKSGNHLISGINEINMRVGRASRHVGYEFFNHRDFIVNRMGAVDHSLYAKSDPTGTHLSSRGIRAIEKSLARFIKL